MSVTCKIMTEGVRPQFVELFPRGMTAGVGPVGSSATPMKQRIRPKTARHIRTSQKRAYLVLTNANGTLVVISGAEAK
jgi:hypothetical protein